MHALVGTISARLDADELDRALADPRVVRVEASCVARTDPAEAATTRRQLSSQSSATWGLDRIDSRDGLDGKYDYGGALGAGSVVYVLDTGVRTSHDDFEGRAEPGWSARCNDVARNCTEWAEFGDITAENYAASKANDCAFSGHGTHVASTVAGKEYGVAKGATVVAVQVLDCRGQGEAADIIGGIEWAVADAAARGTTQAVIQMSITNTYSETQKDVVKAAHDAGVVIVLAAGNRQSDTCGWSYLLGGIHIVINVGSSTSADTVSRRSS